MINKEVLKQTGFTDYESEIYVQLLENNQVSAYELAEKTGMYRQATYDALNRLIEKGFVSSVKEGNTQMFKAINPELILEYLNEKTESFKQILPSLMKLNDYSKDALSVETYKGKNVIRIALRDIINSLKNASKREVLCTAVDESLGLLEHKTIIEQYERDLVYYKIKEKVIIKEGAKGIFQKGTSIYKKIPEKLFNKNPVQVYGNNVQILVWGNPNHLIIIRSKEVAEAYRQQFELMWKVAKK